MEHQTWRSIDRRDGVIAAILRRLGPNASSAIVARIERGTRLEHRMYTRAIDACGDPDRFLTEAGKVLDTGHDLNVKAANRIIEDQVVPGDLSTMSEYLRHKFVDESRPIHPRMFAKAKDGTTWEKVTEEKLHRRMELFQLDPEECAVCSDNGEHLGLHGIATKNQLLARVPSAIRSEVEEAISLKKENYRLLKQAKAKYMLEGTDERREPFERYSAWDTLLQKQINTLGHFATSEEARIAHAERNQHEWQRQRR